MVEEKWPRRFLKRMKAAVRTRAMMMKMRSPRATGEPPDSEEQSFQSVFL